MGEACFQSVCNLTEEQLGTVFTPQPGEGAEMHMERFKGFLSNQLPEVGSESDLWKEVFTPYPGESEQMHDQRIEAFILGIFPKKMEGATEEIEFSIKIERKPLSYVVYVQPSSWRIYLEGLATHFNNTFTDYAIKYYIKEVNFNEDELMSYADDLFSLGARYIEVKFYSDGTHSFDITGANFSSLVGFFGKLSMWGSYLVIAALVSALIAIGVKKAI